MWIKHSKKKLPFDEMNCVKNTAAIRLHRLVAGLHLEKLVEGFLQNNTRNLYSCRLICASSLCQ
jgi:hypothetical protein